MWHDYLCGWLSELSIAGIPRESCITECRKTLRTTRMNVNLLEDITTVIRIIDGTGSLTYVDGSGLISAPDHRLWTREGQ